MNRRRLNFMTLASLLLFVAVVALWVRSHWHDDYAGWASRTFDLRATHGTCPECGTVATSHARVCQSVGRASLRLN
jgi:hypothetical protein